MNLDSYQTGLRPLCQKYHVERDVRSLLHGTKEGKVVVRNVRPVAGGGVREVVDEVAAGRAAVRVDAEETEK